jgi:hypothetical protein
MSRDIPMPLTFLIGTALRSGVDVEKLPTNHISTLVSSSSLLYTVQSVVIKLALYYNDMEYASFSKGSTKY